MDDLVQFLRDRLDEDEALAREAPPGPWHIGNAVDPTQPCNVHTFPGARVVADGLNWLVAEHIARQNPARVLAEVEAKRKLLALYVEHERMDRETFEAEGDHARSLVSLRAAYLDAVRHHAAVYADRPGFREEWRP